RLSASATVTVTRFSLSLRASTIRRFIQTAFRPRCRKRCSSKSWLPFPGWNGRGWFAPATPSNMTMSIRANLIRTSGANACLGCVGEARSQRHRAKMAALNVAKSLTKALTLTPNEAAKHGLALNKDGQRRSAFELLAYPEIGWPQVRGIWSELSAIDPGIAGHLEIDAKYDVYLKRQ